MKQAVAPATVEVNVTSAINLKRSSKRIKAIVATQNAIWFRHFILAIGTEGKISTEQHR